MVKYEAQMIRDGQVIQEFPATEFDCPERAEERAMHTIKNLERMRTVINFENKSRLIIDFFVYLILGIYLENILP